MAQANAAGQQATRQHWQRHWEEQWRTAGHGMSLESHQDALGKSLIQLAEILDKETTPTLLKSYIAILTPLTQEQAITAFKRAGEELRFFPPPSVLLDLAGRQPSEEMLGSPAEHEARAALAIVFQAMRKYGPELKPLPRTVLSDRDADGRMVCRAEWKWSPLDECAPFSDVIEATIALIGFGSRWSGLSVISCHPGLPWNSQQSQDEAPSASFRLRDAEKIEKRWIESYGMVKLKVGA